MSRRGRGEGNLTQLKDGRWQARVSLPDGRRKAFYARTRQDAAAKLNKALGDLHRGLLPGDGRQTTATYLTEWLAIVKSRVRPSTFEHYRSFTENHLIPEVGRIALTKLTPSHVESMLARKLDSGMSPRSVRHMRAVLRNALGRAVKLGIVPRNVAELADAPHVPRPEIEVLAPAQALAFLAGAQTDRLIGAFTVALTMGLRIGEVSGLRWRDVDFDAGTIRIAQAYQRVAGQGAFVEPKSRTSRRQLPMPETTVRALREHRVRQIEEKLLAGPAWFASDLVFTAESGRPLNPSSTTRHLQNLLRAMDLPPVGFHGLRHSCASLLLAQGVHARLVMELLGHSGIALTMNTYSHVTPALKADVANRMDQLLESGG